jgi:RNase P subunit RPR2
MDIELIQLLEKLCGLPDDDLIKMVNLDFADYNSEALGLARIVMKRRGYALSKKGNIVDSRKTESPESRGRQPEPASQNADGKEQAAELNKLLRSIYCPRCNAKLDYAGTRRLNEEKSMGVLGELGQMYRSGTHEFLDVYTCAHCGHVEFFVDGVGDELRPY